MRAVAFVLCAFVLASCSSAAPEASPSSPGPSRGSARSPGSLPTAPAPAGDLRPSTAPLLPGMPPPLAADDVWSADRPGRLAPGARRFLDRVYVPNSGSGTVSVIDPRRRRVVSVIRTGTQPQHVVPSWDLKTLWVANDRAGTLTPVDPVTARRGRSVRVHDPYNLYFTPDGRSAVVMASADRELVYRDPHTMAVQHVTHVPCEGVNHADFSADGRTFLVSCEFDSTLLRVATTSGRVLEAFRLRPRGRGPAPKPQDVKLSPDGRHFYVADMTSNGVWVISADRLHVLGFIRTGRGAHGLYITRDSKGLLVTNRDEGTISVLDMRTDRVVHRWHIPGGSPDIGGLSADGRTFWVSGRYDAEVYAVSTTDGHLIARMPVGRGPHGLCVYPQPGRYSLGHTGIMR